MGVLIHQQCHGYRSGHQMLAGSIILQRSDQDVIDRLSDVSGPLRPDETFAPYITAYPLPSGEYYVLARTWHDLGAPRAGCVLTRSLLVPMPMWLTLPSPSSLINLLHPVDRSISEVPAVSPTTDTAILPVVNSPRATELVEALFLENRRAYRCLRGIRGGVNDKETCHRVLAGNAAALQSLYVCLGPPHSRRAVVRSAVCPEECAITVQRVDRTEYRFDGNEPTTSLDGITGSPNF